MAQAAKSNITRRSALQFLGLAGAAAAVPVVTASARGPQERIAEHLRGISEAWAEIYGEPPRVAEYSHEYRYVLVTGSLSDQTE